MAEDKQPLGKALAIEGGRLAGGAGIGGLIGMGVTKWENKQQLKMAKELQKLQLSGAKDMQALGLDTWSKTGPTGYRKELEKAGLNAGLMYGMSGGGGQTTGSGAMPNLTGGTSGALGMGIQLGLSAQKTIAETANIKQDTEKKEAETKETYQNIFESGERILKLTAETDNIKTQKAGIEYANELLRIESELNKMSMEDVAKALKANAEKLTAEAEVAVGTKDELIKQAKQNTTEQIIRMAALKAGIKKTEVDTQAARKNIEVMAGQIQTMLETNAQNWEKLSQKDMEIAIEKELQKFQTSAGAHVGQWTGAIKDIAASIAYIATAARGK